MSDRGEVHALVDDIIDAVTRKDGRRLVELTTPDVEWHSFFAIGKRRVYRGHDEIREYASDLADAWDVIEPRLDDVLVVGDVAVLVGWIHFRGRTSAVDAEEPAGWVFKFRDGRLAYFRAFRDPEGILGAAGVP
jgi:ketosteroid isomerase-like protein